MSMNNLESTVINLHDIARLIEQQIGKGTLAADVRKCADQLSNILSPLPPGDN